MYEQLKYFQLFLLIVNVVLSATFLFGSIYLFHMVRRDGAEQRKRIVLANMQRKQSTPNQIKKELECYGNSIKIATSA